jgi:Spy/CpxP family protein refolding chaperone
MLNQRLRSFNVGALSAVMLLLVSHPVLAIDETIEATGQDTALQPGQGHPPMGQWGMNRPGMHREGMNPPGMPEGMGHWNRHRWGHGNHHAGWMKALGLTPEQVNKINNLRSAQRAQMMDWHAKMRANRVAMMTTAPTDPGYGALVSQNKELMAQKIQAKADLKAQIYKDVLTDEQRTFATAWMKHMKVVMANRAQMANAKKGQWGHDKGHMSGPQGE